MKKLLMCLCLVAAMFLSGTAYGAWMYAQGNVTEIEYPGKCSNIRYAGWGLDFLLNSGQVNWVHMPVPTGPNTKARYIRVKFYTGSVDAWVSAIHVYNGNGKVKEFLDLSYSNGWKDIMLDMGSTINFLRGMGISFEIKAGVEMMSHRMIFSAAGANFVP